MQMVKELQEVLGLTTQPRNLVSEIRQQLEARIGNDRFELWFGGKNSISVDGTVLVVSAMDEFSMDRMKTTYTEDLKTISADFDLDDLQFKLDEPGENSSSTQLEPGTVSAKLLTSGVSAPVSTSAEGAGYTFSIPIKLNGSGGIRFEPVGKSTKVTLRSTWPSPSFTGDFLPDEREAQIRRGSD